MPQVAALAREVAAAMRGLADRCAVGSRAPGELSLRESQTALRAALGRHPELLVTETDAMVDAVDTIHHLLADAGADARAAPAGP